MKIYTTLLEEVLESWADARNGVISELNNISPKDFGYKPAKEMRSILEIGIHILEVAMMMTGELTRPDTNFRRAPWPELLKLYAAPAYRVKTKQQLLRLMRSQLKDGIARFQKAGELHMLQLIQRFDGSPGTRLAWLNHAIDQEMYHRGQITTYARLLGREPALTKLIRGG